MEVFIGGKSPIDLQNLTVDSVRDANLFIQNYGYNPGEKIDQKKMHAVLIEAVNFIEQYLMPKEWKHGLRPPLEVLECDDPRKLLLWATSHRKNEDSHKQLWSCAILKVMHTISHLDDLHRMNNIKEARSQIMGRFHKALFRDADGKLWFGDREACIELEKMEWKPYKSRNSIILKLLHKPANVAETIYDLLGVRIVTKNLSETLIAVKYLRQFYLVDFANIHPGRSRNNLIDVGQFHSHAEALREMLANGNITPEGFENMMLRLNTPVNRRQSSNPHSSSQFRAIQLTCRQRVRYFDPQRTWQEKIEALLRNGELDATKAGIVEDILFFVNQWQDSEKQKEISIFFPFEVQIMDAEAAKTLEFGEASHDRYKRSQIRTARRRILYKILNI